MATLYLAPKDTFKIYISRRPNKKSGYKLKYSGLSASQIGLYWNGLNIGLGYRAKVVCEQTGEIMARKS